MVMRIFIVSPAGNRSGGGVAAGLRSGKADTLK
jgi:hypothetical protein